MGRPPDSGAHSMIEVATMLSEFLAVTTLVLVLLTAAGVGS